MFTRLPNYYLASSSRLSKDNSTRISSCDEANKETKQRVEGHFVQYCYYFDNTAGAVPSALQIIRNYQNAAARSALRCLASKSTRATTCTRP